MKTDWKTPLFLFVMMVHDYKLTPFYLIYWIGFVIIRIMERRERKKEMLQKSEAAQRDAKPDEP